MPEWSEGVVQANGLNVFYHRTEPGTKRPPILLLHGITDNGLCWSRVARNLEETYDVIMTDARGHGRTEGPLNDFGTNLLAEDAAAVTRQLGLEKTYLLGHSMGALTAIALAANHPEQVRAVVLVDPPLRQFTPQENQMVLAWQQHIKALQIVSLEKRIALGRTQNPQWSDDDIFHMAEAQGEFNPEILSYMVNFASYSWRETISRLACPVMLITGEARKGAIVTPELAQEAAQLCEFLEVANISEASHNIYKDHFKETMQVLQDFLNQH